MTLKESIIIFLMWTTGDTRDWHTGRNTGQGTIWLVFETINTKPFTHKVLFWSAENALYFSYVHVMTADCYICFSCKCCLQIWARGQKLFFSIVDTACGPSTLLSSYGFLCFKVMFFSWWDSEACFLSYHLWDEDCMFCMSIINLSQSSARLDNVCTVPHLVTFF